jgi:DNA-binding LytR/AlgR family response regulator
MRTLIIDDEPRAIALLEQYLAHFADFTVVGTFRNGLKAFEFMQREPVELIFLDINMPHLTGISLARMINPAVSVIFTTAFAEFAAESYEVSAVDYLLKPISLERFTQAIAKVLTTRATPPAQAPGTAEPTVVLVKSGTEVHRIDIDSILYLEKDGNYLTYHLADRRVLARASTAEALAALPAYFVRVHKSYIVNTRRITVVRKEELGVGEVWIPIGASYRAGLLERLGP